MNKSNVERISDTKLKLTVEASKELLDEQKTLSLKKFSKQVKVPGFRKGQVPLDLVAKNVDESLLQSDFLEGAITKLYREAAVAEKLRPIAEPEITISKFVPFTVLEIVATVEVIGEVKLPDYKKIKKTLKANAVSDEDVNNVIENLRKQLAEKVEHAGKAKEGDEIWINFAGYDKNGNEIERTSGKDYPLSIGSNTFIPGFEPNMIGLKAGDQKEFNVTFPADYGNKSLAGEEVLFKVEVNKVKKVNLPEVNDELAKKVGPFKSLEELKSDIKKQLGFEAEKQARTELANELLLELSEKTVVELPDSLVEEQIAADLKSLKNNLMYSGISLDDYLKELKLKDETELAEKEIAPKSRNKIKIGILLTEIAERENLQVSNEELDREIDAYLASHQDPTMRAQLQDPANRRQVASQMLSQKTVDKLLEYATK